MAKKPTTPVEHDPITARAAERIIKAFKALGETYQVEGLHTRPVMTKDGYRQKPLDPDSEFFISAYWIGAKGQIVFKCVPADSKPYDFADVDDKKMDDVFPLAGPAVAEKLGIKEEDFVEVVRTVKAQIVAEDAELKAVAEQVAADDAAEYEKLKKFARF